MKFGGDEPKGRSFTFIAVNYNGASHTKKYLESVGALNKDVTDEVKAIIVDNKSSEDDRRQVLDFSKNLDYCHVIELEKNIGYFKGLNAALQTLSCPSNGCVIIGNNDLTFDPDFLINLKRIEYASDVLVIAPNIITLDGRRQNPHVIRRVGRMEKVKADFYFFNYYLTQSIRVIVRLAKRLKRKKDKVSAPEFGQMRIKRGIGACYVLTPHFFRHFDRLDDRVFLWGEEALLSHQVESVAGATLYDPTIKITHHESASVSFIDSKARYEIVRESYKIYREYL